MNQDVWVLVYTNEYGKVQDVEVFTTREKALAAYSHDTGGANFDDDHRVSLMAATIQAHAQHT